MAENIDHGRYTAQIEGDLYCWLTAHINSFTVYFLFLFTWALVCHKFTTSGEYFDLN